MDVKSHVTILMLQTPRQLVNWSAWTRGHVPQSSVQAISPNTKQGLEQCFPEPFVMLEMDPSMMCPLSR